MQAFLSTTLERSLASASADRVGVRHIGEIVPHVLARYGRELCRRESRCDGGGAAVSAVVRPVHLHTEVEHAGALTEDVGRNRD